MATVNKLVVVSHVIHYAYEGRLYAFGPYSREIDIWADLFPEVLIASPLRHEAPPADSLPFTRPNISMIPQREIGGLGLRNRIWQLCVLPLVIWDLCRAMMRADAIHVRCPGNLGMLGAILAPLFSRYLIAKYAGQWNGFASEGGTTKIQRAVLSSRWWRGPVTVYGDWPNQPRHIVPFFTSILSREQLSRAGEVAKRKRFHDPLRVLYVGRLSRQKNIHVLLAAVAGAVAAGRRLECTIVGCGQEHERLRRLSEELALGAEVRFAGGVTLEEVLEHYAESDVLVLVSENEGWGKVLLEAMAFGLVCIGSDRGLMPMILGEERGIVVPAGDAEALREALLEIARSPGRYESMGKRASEWAQHHSLEDLRAALRVLLQEHWGANIVERSFVEISGPTESPSATVPSEGVRYSA